MATLRGRFHNEAVKFWKGIKRVTPFIEVHEEEEESKYGGFDLESTSASLIVIPDTESITEVDVRYPLLQPFADAHIYWDDEEEELVYEIEEPTLNEEQERIFEEVRDALEKKISVPLSKLETSEKVVDYLQGEMRDVLAELGYSLKPSAEHKLMYYVYRNFGGLNEIEPMMHDPYIEDIGCSGTGIPIYIIHTKFGSIKTRLKFDDEDNLRNLIVKLAERANKYVSYSDPLLDGTLPDGSRVNASLTQDVTTKGPTFSIRKFQEVPFSAVDLLDLGTVNLDLMAYMWLCMQYQKSALIIGGTATGKTTFLNSIVSFIPPELKIVSIEDTRELQLPHENWIPSVTRTSAGEEQEDITMYQLLRESFRQNPDYVVVGEVRGEEASVLFQGMASGHPSLSTMHASTPSDVVSRLTTPPINLSPSLVETLDIIVSITHAREWGENARRVKAVYEIEDISKEGSARTNQYFSWTAVDDTFSEKKDSTVMDKVKQQYGLDEQDLKEEIHNRKKVLKWLHDHGFTHFEKVSGVVSEYYKDPDRVMDMVSESTSTGFEDIVGDSTKELPQQIERERQELQESIERGETPAGKPGQPSPEAGQPGEVDYEALLQNPVDTVKNRVESEGLDPEKVLRAEKAGQNRITLVRWLRSNIEGGEQEREESEPRTSSGSAEREGEMFEGDAEMENPFE